MSLQQAFRDELNFLRLQGKAFARHNPQLVRFLGERANDPDVERLLEGFAFLTAKLRLKLEDDFEELSHSLLQLLWPNYLRPIPSMTIIQFTPVEGAIAGSHTIARGATLESLPVDGVACRFRTCTDLSIHPLRIEGVECLHTRESSTVGVELRVLSDQGFDTLDCDRLDFHLSGDDYTAQTLYLWMARYLRAVRIVTEDAVRELGPDVLAFPGFEPGEALLPYPRNVFDGYRILQEYFTFPRRFYFIGVNCLGAAWPSDARHARVEFIYSRPLPVDVKVGLSDLSLHCVPAVNLFEHDAEPINLDGRSNDYALQPVGGRSDAFEIFSVDEVTGWKAKGEQPGGGILRRYHDFHSFQHEIERSQNRTSLYFRARLHAGHDEAVANQRIAFVRGDERRHPGARETISVSLTCSNGRLPVALGAGDIAGALNGVPPFVVPANIVAPTAPYRPLLDGSLHWRLISNLSLNYLSLLAVEPLKAVIRIYDFAALSDAQAERASRKRLAGIRSAVTSPSTTLIRGLPVRGLRTELGMDPSAFLCEGDMYLLGTVLSRFFALYASINAFHVLEVRNTSNNETYEWPLRRGNQPVI